MSKTLSILAAAAALLVVGAASAPVAEAGGGGVRLNFGYPLGSFVARPSGSSSSHSYRAPSYAHHERQRAARAAAVAEARREAAANAKRAAIAEARREAAADAKRAAVAEAKREAAAEARREKLAEERAEARRVARLAEQREENAEKVAKVEPAVLETVSLAPDAAPLPGRPDDLAQADVAIGEPKVVLDDVAAKETVSSPANKAKPTVAAAASSDRVLDCKKFIPSAGLTISVPCAN